MRPIKAVRLAVVLCLTLATGSASAQNDAARAEIEAQYAQIVEGLYKGDAGPLDKAAHPDFKYITILGKENPKDVWSQEIKQITGRYQAAPTTTITPKLFTIQNEEATAVFTVKATGEGTAQDGRKGELNISTTERTTWVKGEDGWRIKLAKHVMSENRLGKSLVPFPRTPQEKETIQGIQAIYDLMGETYTKQDWDAIEKLVPENQPIKDAAGTPLSKKDLVERMKNSAKNLSNPIMFILSQQMEQSGTELRVVRLARLIADVKMPDGKNGRLIYLSVARDLFTKGEKGWNAKSSEELHSEASLDGKLIPLSLIGGK
jgi:hypothetical protein